MPESKCPMTTYTSPYDVNLNVCGKVEESTEPDGTKCKRFVYQSFRCTFTPDATVDFINPTIIVRSDNKVYLEAHVISNSDPQQNGPKNFLRFQFSTHADNNEYDFGEFQWEGGTNWIKKLPIEGMKTIPHSSQTISHPTWRFKW